jgi:hypothetical protein
MRELLLRSIIGVSTFLVVYLLAAFVKVSFDFSLWSEECRAVVAIFGGALGLASSTFPGHNFKKK